MAKRLVTYYGVAECARALGVTRQRAGRLAAEGKFPPADATIGGKPAWEATAFNRFAAERTAAIRRTPIGLDPAAARGQVTTGAGPPST